MRTQRQGFTLVEALAVVLLMAILAGFAIPLYLNTRRSSAARVCLANIATIMAAESAYGLRFGGYVGANWDQQYSPPASGSQEPLGGLIGAPEGLASIPHCPLDGSSYLLNVDTFTGDLTITCPNAALHAMATSKPASLWEQVYRAPGKESALP